MTGANLNILLKHLKEHEGFSAKAYQDHLGHWTIGYGRRIDGDKGLSMEEAQNLLANDVEDARAQLAHAIKLPENLDEVRHAALVAMVFQLGIGTFQKFKKMIRAVELPEWEEAAKEALDSRWADQTPRRARTVARILKTGSWSG